jgi:hypothetical protein
MCKQIVQMPDGTVIVRPNKHKHKHTHAIIEYGPTKSNAARSWQIALTRPSRQAADSAARERALRGNLTVAVAEITYQEE